MKVRMFAVVAAAFVTLAGVDARAQCASGRYGSVGWTVSHRGQWGTWPSRGTVATTPAYPVATTPTVTHYAPIVYQTLAPSAPSPTVLGAALSAVNAARARVGLRPLAWDAVLAATCAANNAEQSRRGLGHHRISAAQCAAMAGTEGHAVSQWLGSPPHYAIMMSPSATRGAVVVSHGYATLEVR